MNLQNAVNTYQAQTRIDNKAQEAANKDARDTFTFINMSFVSIALIVVVVLTHI